MYDRRGRNLTDLAQMRGEGRVVTYCVIPRDLAARLHEPLRRHFADDPSVTVVVERRALDRRVRDDRRAEAAEVAAERRRVRGAGGRRAGERRAALVPVDAPGLPRRARAHRDRLVFVERIEPSAQRVEDLDTARLVAEFQAGEQDAFSSLYMRYFDRVYAYLKVVYRDAHEAEDATQQVFMKVLEALPRYERRKQPFRAWLFVVVRNHAIGEMKKLKRFEPIAPAEMSRRREPEEHEEDRQILDWITDRELLMFVERLPEAQRQVLMLRFLLDLTHTEVATVLGRNPDDVRGLQHRALAFLRERLVALGRAPERSDKSARMRRVRDHALVLRSRRFALVAGRGRDRRPA
jgi:RNA polymerase sigma-70 factor (ECF subfamily)